MGNKLFWRYKKNTVTFAFIKKIQLLINADVISSLKRFIPSVRPRKKGTFFGGVRKCAREVAQLGGGGGEDCFYGICVASLVWPSSK